MTKSIKDPAQQVRELLGQIYRTKFPRLTVEDCDGEIVFRCPTCGHLVGWMDLSAVHFTERWSWAWGPSQAASVSGGTVLFEYGSDIYSHSSALWYEHADHPVSLPSGWREGWR